MIGVTQQNSKQDNLSTLKAVLEEEPDINTNHVNDAIPFDKCIEADKQADEEEKKRRWYSQLGTAKTTKEQSKKEIKEWLEKGIFMNIERENSAFQNRDERSVITCIR